MCGGGPGMLTGVWDLPSGAMTEPAQQARIRQAFLRTGKGYAREVFATVSDALTAYARRWAAMYQETCEATHVRGDQVGGGPRPSHVVPERTTGRSAGAHCCVRRSNRRGSRTCRRCHGGFGVARPMCATWHRSERRSDRPRTPARVKGSRPSDPARRFESQLRSRAMEGDSRRDRWGRTRGGGDGLPSHRGRGAHDQGAHGSGGFGAPLNRHWCVRSGQRTPPSRTTSGRERPTI